MNKFVYTALIAGSVAVSSCTTDDLNPTLAQEKEGDEAISSVSDLEVIMKGAYNRMTDASYYGRDYLVTNEVRTPNTWSNGRSGRFVTQASFNQNPNGLFIWAQAYGVIANANVVINQDLDELEGPGGTEPDLDYARHIQGQAYATRALVHFDLLKTYGQQHVGGNLGVPYVTEYRGENTIPSRNTIEENISMIMSDLDTAFELMGEDFFDPSREFMSKYTAPALKSRVAVYFGMWEEARDAAELVIESGRYSVVSADQFYASFQSDGSVNSIFELAFSETDNPGSNSMEYIYRGRSYGDISVTEEAFNNLYEGDDVREEILGTENVAGTTRLRNMGKFPERGSNINVIRYEEVILNYAEALYELGEGDPLEWLNMIPENRNADTYDVVTKENILEERREEFIFEGLYYWDLLRTEQDIVRTQADQPLDIPYGDFRLAYPIPFSELDANSNIEQNPGYQG